jgi:hypothetical protein
MTNMTGDENIAFWFRPPERITEPKDLGTMSTLFMLRREIQFCLIDDLTDEDAVIGVAMSRGEYRLFASMMVTMACTSGMERRGSASCRSELVSPKLSAMPWTSGPSSNGHPSDTVALFYVCRVDPEVESVVHHSKEKKTCLVQKRYAGLDAVDRHSSPVAMDDVVAQFI